jgi:hypothetical protein
MTQFVYTAEHEIYYNVKTPVPIADVIASLQALERLLKSMPRALEKLSDVTISRTEVFIERVKSGSLWEKIAINFFFDSEEELHAFLKKIKVKIDGKPVVKSAIIGAVFGGLAVYGAMLATKTASGPTTSIQANNNVIMNFGAGQVGLTPEGFQSVIESAVTNKTELARAAVQLMVPARNDPNSQITLDGRDQLVITSESIESTPRSVKEVPLQAVDELTGVYVRLRATDLDNKKTGWAGAIEDRTGRLKVEIDPALEPDALFGKTRFRADVSLIRKPKTKGGELEPALIVIRKIY